MNKNKAKALAKGVLCSVLSLMLVLVGIYVPSLLMVMTFLAGVPMMYLGMRRGVRVIGASFLASVLLLSFITGDLISSVLTGIMNFLPGIVLGRALRRRRTFAEIIFAGAGAILFGLVLQLVILNAMGDGHGIENIVNQAFEGVRQNMNEMVASMNGQLSVPNQDLQAMMNQTIDLVRDTIFLYLPAILIGGSVVVSYLLFMVSTFILHRLRQVRIIYLPFWGFCAPRSMCYLAAVLFLITSMSSDSTVWTAALRNVMVLLYGYFGVCGCSFIDYKLRKRVSSGYVRVAIYFVVFCVGYLIMGMLFQGLYVLGMLDGVFGFRMREERVGHE